MIPLGRCSVRFKVQKTFEDFSQRSPFARFSADTLSPKIDIAESKDAIDLTAELPGVDAGASISLG